MNLENFKPLRTKPTKQSFSSKDVLVLFGELFNRGYANGLVEEAEKFGVTIIRSTVGRRSDTNELRALTTEESAAIPQPFINIPLEAGFDYEKDSEGLSPNDRLKGIKLSEWEHAQLPMDRLKESEFAGEQRFRNQVRLYIQQLTTLIEKQIVAGGHIHFAHLMAGGVPRTKIVMPLMNRVFKGTGDRHLSSKAFIDSSIGQFMLMNFNQVTAKTFDILIEETKDFRELVKRHNGSCSYVAYGYHGTEVIINGDYKWQSYAPYIQGWAKCQLEDYSKFWSNKGVQTCVYNCPEILTNSSSIFQGVEIPLYNLIRALEQEIPHHALTQKMRQDCENALKNPNELNQIFKWIDDFMIESENMGTSVYKNWPQHSVQAQLEKTLKLSDEIIALHKDENALMTAVLSEIIFKSCGYIMLHEAYKPAGPVAWIGHDMIAQCVD